MGIIRSCVKFVEKTGVKHAKGGKALRCVEFKEGLRHPMCPSPSRPLRGGGRSQADIRPAGCKKSRKVRK